MAAGSVPTIPPINITPVAGTAAAQTVTDNAPETKTTPAASTTTAHIADNPATGVTRLLQEVQEELYVAKAQKELYEVQLLSLDAVSDTDPAFLEKATKYEMEIGRLRHALRSADAKLNCMEDRIHSSRQLEEDRGEEEEIHQLTKKYLALAGHMDDDDDNDENLNQDNKEGGSSINATGPGPLTELIEVTRSIAAKEELIDQLLLSEEKYAVRVGSLPGQ
jgi:hypothetical protein